MSEASFVLEGKEGSLGDMLAEALLPIRGVFTRVLGTIALHLVANGLKSGKGRARRGQYSAAQAAASVNVMCT